MKPISLSGQSADILFISLSPFDSIYSCSIRNQSLIKGLLELGHHVDFLTVGNETGVKREGKLVPNSMFRIVKINSGSIEKATQTKTRSISYFGNIPRLVYHRFFLFEFIGKAVGGFKINQLRKRNYDVVISSSDPKATHVFTKNILRRGLKYKQWIQYWGDPLTIDITNKTIYPMWYKQRVEGNLLNAADKVVYTSPFTLECQQRLFPKAAHKMVALATPYFEIKNYPKTNNSVFVVGYHGNYHSRYRDIGPLMAAFEILGTNYELDVVGGTDLDLKSRANINVYSATGDIEAFEQRSDLLIVLLNKRGTQIPGKVFHLAGTNKPILVIVDGEHKNELGRYLRSFNRYHVCDNDQVAIANEIVRIKNARVIYQADPQFSAGAVAKNFLEPM